MGNRQTEQSATEHVMALERAAGREPKDVHATGLPYDVDSPPRKIEVKAFSRSARSEALPLEDRQVTEAKADPDHYYVYVVDNLAGSDGAEVRVRILHGDVLLAMIKRSRPQITYWPTFKAAEYDQAEQLR
ncbi:protein NO VEIN domain-containing protein [Streptomyces sp. NPDC058217]|uniref:protein NO VEIN domain-containing protein n=1 Tax=Streptomyces sp. NPDC058217 TaxID=3346384 RepID=UPI0036E550BE